MSFANSIPKHIAVSNSTFFPRPLYRVGRSIVLYKFFILTRKKVMRGPYTDNRDLQKVGDKRSVTGQLVMCRNGWHAGDAAYIRNNLIFSFSDRKRRIFKVRLSGGVWTRDRRKRNTEYLGRTIELLQEVTMDSRRRFVPLKETK